MIAYTSSRILRLLPPHASAPPAVTIVGIDLAGVPRRETRAAVLRGGALVALAGAGDDEAILVQVAAAGAGALIAINAPLTLPRGRCGLDDKCPCRHDPGTRRRALERELLRLKVPILAMAHLKVLARRGMVLDVALRARPRDAAPAGPAVRREVDGAGQAAERGRVAP